MLDILSRSMARIFASGNRIGPLGTQFPLFAAAPAAIGDGGTNFDPVFLTCGLAVLSAGLVVMHAANTLPRQAVARAATGRETRRLYTAEEALLERDRMRGETSVLVDALAEAAATFYAIAGQLPAEASERAVQRADDLRELVWLNRAG
ncbi:MAG: hypothetical protein U0837_06355 [Dehalococcoidia bacterium]|jgi:hypothetical protein